MKEVFNSKYIKRRFLEKVIEKEIGSLNLSEEDIEVVSNNDPLREEWMDYKLTHPTDNLTSFIEIPLNYKDKERGMIIYLGKFYGINAKDAKIIYQAFKEDISFKKLGGLYNEFKENYNPIEIASVLGLFKNDVNKVRYTIGINFIQDFKEALYITAMRVKKERGLNQYAKNVEEVISDSDDVSIENDEEPLSVPTLYELSEMTNGRLSDDRSSLMNYFFRVQREDEKRVNQHKGMNLDKALKNVGMHIV